MSFFFSAKLGNYLVPTKYFFCFFSKKAHLITRCAVTSYNSMLYSIL